MVDDSIVLLTPTSAQEEKMWEKSQDHIEEDEKMIEAWKGEGDGILAFVSLNLLIRLFTISMRSFKTGLLSATIGIFVIEFYKKLSPDSGGQTVDLLGQISQQLTNPRNDTSITAANDQNQSFSPSISMIWVNAMWLISLVFSITSALITSLNQQAARRYIEMRNVKKQKNDNARVSSFLFRGIQKYKMPLAIFAAPTLLHISILLFFGGLVIVFHTIYEKVAIAVDAAVGISALVYLAMSLLPLLSGNCPYRTPITNLLWYSWHAFLFLTAYFGLFLLAQRLPGCSCLCPCTCTCLDSDSLSKPESLDKPDSSDGAGSGTQYILPGLSNLLGEVAEKHGRYLKDGFPKSVINSATTRQEDDSEDRKTITWLFIRLSLGDKNKFLEFAASIPRSKVLVLIPPIKSGKIVLRQPLLVLLRSCTDDAGAVGSNEDEDVRKGALITCLTSINCIAKTPSIPDLNFVRGEFAKVSRMRALWSHDDDSIRIASLSICALVARQVLRKSRIEEEDQSWLQEVIGEPPSDSEADRMNFKSFVYGALRTGDDANHLSPENETSLKETLAILLDVEDNRIDFTTPDWRIRLTEEIGQIQHFDREVFDRLYPMFPSLSSAPSVNIAPPSIYSGAPSNPIYAGPEARYFRHDAPSTQAPSIYREPPSMPVEDPSVRYTVPSQASYREGPSSPVEPYPSVPAPRPRPRPRRASRPSQVTRPPLVIPPPRAVSPHHGVLPPQVPPSPRIVFSTRAPSPPHVVPPPLAASPSSLMSTSRHADPHPFVVPSAATPRHHRAASSPQVTRPPVTTFSQTINLSRAPPPAHTVSSAPGPFSPPLEVPPPRAPSPPHEPLVSSAPDLFPPRWEVPSPRAPPSPHEPPDSFAPGSFRPTREPFPPGHYEPPVHYAPGSLPPPRARSPSRADSSAPGAIPPPRAVFAPSSAPPPRAGPSSSAAPPSVPPTPRTASPSRITRRSHTARPPHAPV